MRSKKRLERYDVEVEKQNYIPDQENPERIEITFSFEYKDERYTITPPAFSPRQVANGQWEQQACIYIDDKIDEIEGGTKHEVPDLEGEKLSNSGYDFTGPERDYPER